MGNYAQKSYLQVQGRPGGKYPPKFTMAEIGCFVVSFANLTGIDPLVLNAAFRDKGIYVDVDDGILDDLAWDSINRHDSNWKVWSTNNNAKGAWPQSNNAIVKFVYQSIQHPWIDAAKTKPNILSHFCKVANWQQQTIVDSWDGLVKMPGVYGSPVMFAEYQHFEPQPVTPVLSAPAAGSEQWVHLPTAAVTWAAYKPGSGLRKGTDDQKDAKGNFMTLRPDLYNLHYHVIQWIGDRAVVIDTESYGRVAIWVKGTIAQFYTKQPEVVAPPAPQPVPAPVSEPQAPIVSHPAPESTPPADTPEAEAPKLPEKVEQLPYENDDWKETFNKNPRRVEVEVDTVAIDLEGQRKDIPIRAKQYEKIGLPVLGDLKKDGVKYYVLRAASGGEWYGVRPDDLEEDFFSSYKIDQAKELASNLKRNREAAKNLQGKVKFSAFLGTVSGLLHGLWEILTLKNK